MLPPLICFGIPKYRLSSKKTIKIDAKADSPIQFDLAKFELLLELQNICNFPYVDYEYFPMREMIQCGQFLRNGFRDFCLPATVLPNAETF